MCIRRSFNENLKNFDVDPSHNFFSEERCGEKTIILFPSLSFSQTSNKPKLIFSTFDCLKCFQLVMSNSNPNTAYLNMRHDSLLCEFFKCKKLFIHFLKDLIFLKYFLKMEKAQ